MTEVYVSTSDSKSAYHEDEDCTWLERANEYMAVDKSEVVDDLKACRSCAYELPVDRLGVTMSGKSSGFMRAQREAYLILALMKEDGLGLAEIKDKYGVLYQTNDGWPTIMREMSINTLENYMSELVQKGFAEYTNDGVYIATEKGVSVVSEPIEHAEDEVELAKWAIEQPHGSPKERLTAGVDQLTAEEIKEALEPSGEKFAFSVSEVMQRLNLPATSFKEFKIRSRLSERLKELLEQGEVGKFNRNYVHPNLKLVFKDGQLETVTVEEPKSIVGLFRN